MTVFLKYAIQLFIGCPPAIVAGRNRHYSTRAEKNQPKTTKNFFKKIFPKTLDKLHSIFYNNSDERVSSTCFPLPSRHLTSYRPASAGFHLHKELQKLHKLETSSQLPDIFPDFLFFFNLFLFFIAFLKNFGIIIGEGKVKNYGNGKNY